MSKRFDPLADVHPLGAGAARARPSGGAAVVAIVLLALWTLAAAAAAAPSAADREEAEQLLAELGGRYEILPLAESYVLQPSASEAPFDVIEVRPGVVTVDGEEMDREELRQLIGDDADLVHSLAELGRQESAPVLAGGEPREEVDPRRHRIQTDTRISFGSSLTIEEDEIARDVVVIGGALDVGGEIDGDATVIGGSVEVRGEVDGSVTAVGGSVSLGPEALVDGDVSAIGGVVHRDPGARIHGEITEFSLGDWEGFEGWDWHFDPWPFGKRHGGEPGWFRFAWIDFVDLIAKGVLLVVAVFLILLFARRYTSAIADRIDREPWKAGLVGLAAQVLFFPVLLVVFIVLMISIIGIPLALLLLPASLLLMTVLFFLGYAGAALFAGRKLGERMRIEWYSPFFAALLGILLIQGWSILGEGFSFVGGPIKLIAFLLILTGFLVKYFAWTVGLGSVLLHGFAPLPARGGTAALPASAYPQPSYAPPPPPAPSRPASPPPAEPLIAPPPPPPDEDADYLEAGGGPPEPRADKGSRSPETEDDEVYRDAGKKPSSGDGSQRG